MRCKWTLAATAYERQVVDALRNGTSMYRRFNFAHNDDKAPGVCAFDIGLTMKFANGSLPRRDAKYSGRNAMAISRVLEALKTAIVSVQSQRYKNPLASLRE